MNNLEIERKWLVKYIPPYVRMFPYVIIEQAYVLDIDKTVLRVRTAYKSEYDNYGLITVKSPSNVPGAVQEYEYKIPYHIAHVLISGCDKKISKTRYFIQQGNYMIELDVFGGAHNGLIIAEVEDPGAGFGGLSIPEWFDKEVTGDSKYSNANLVKNQ